jgi:hypothetical protein
LRLSIADTSRIELVARTVVNLRLRPCHASLIGGDRRSNSGSLAKFAAMRRASSLVSSFAAARRPGSSSK